MNVTTQETGYKVLAGWYRTPIQLHKFSPTYYTLCWRCGSEPGSLLHLWWFCSKMQTFYREIHEMITKRTTYNLDLTPTQYVLHHSSLPKSTYYKSLALHLVNVARHCIPLKWGSSTPPTLSHWHRYVCQTPDMEELISIARGSPFKFTRTWACWLHYLDCSDS